MTGRPVLVVEDHEDTRHMVEDFLEFSGIPNVSAQNGLEALKAVQRHRPCLILLDLSMPVMDGWRFREEQRRLPERSLARIPVVVVSAFNGTERHAEALDAVDVIPKPIDFNRMLSVVRTHCAVDQPWPR